MSEGEKACRLCGKTFNGFGHNPSPLGRGRGRCCDDCNGRVVVPVRLFLHRLGLPIDGYETKGETKCD